MQSEREPPYCRTPGPEEALLGLSWLTRGPEPEPAEDEELPLLLLVKEGGSVSPWVQA